MRDYSDVIRRRSPYVVVGLVVGLFLGAAYLVVTPPEYSSAAEVLVRSIRQEPFDSTGPGIDRELSMSTEREVASSGAVAERAAQILGSEVTAGTMLRQVQVELPTSTQVLRFVFRADTAVGAADGANAFASAYLELRETRVLDEVQTVVAGIDNRVERLEAEQTDAQGAAAAAADASLQTSLELQAAQLGAQLTALRERRNALVTMDTRPGVVTQQANTPPTSIGPSRTLGLGVGAAIGILLGLMAGLVREVTDDRVRDAADVATRLGSPILAALPSRHLSDRLVEPARGEPASRTYAMLAARAFQPNRWDRCHVLMVTSAAIGDGKSHVSANLAVACAVGPNQVLLVGTSGQVPDELEARKRRTAAQDRIAGELAGTVRIDLPELPNDGGVWFLDLGDDQWFDPRRAESALAHARAHYDLVIVDVRAALSYPDTSLLAQSTDAVIVVANAERTTRSELEQLAVVLEEARAEVAGAVLNRTRTRTRWRLGRLRPGLGRSPARDTEHQHGAVAARAAS